MTKSTKKLRFLTTHSGRSLQVVSPNDLIPDPKNPRRHNPRQVQLLGVSIKTHGFNVPILIDKNLNIISGHCRQQAALSVGLKEVPTIELTALVTSARL